MAATLPRQFWGALACFFLFGMGFGLWGGHVASIEDRIGDSEVAFGSALVGAAIGLIFSAPLVGPLSKRFGTAVVIRGGSAFYFLALCGVFWVTSPLELFGYTLVIGFASGIIDVAVNAQVSITERETKKSLLSRAHAMWSLGGCFGAGSALIFLAFDQRTLHITLALFLLPILGGIAMMNLYGKDKEEDESESQGGALAAEEDSRPLLKRDTAKAAIVDGLGGWKNPVLLAMGGVALFGLVLESGMMDWMPVYFADYRGTSLAGSALVFTFFSAVIFCVRMFGDTLRERFRDKHILVGGGFVSGLSLALGLFVENDMLSVGIMSIAGIGIAYVYPLVTSRAAAYRAPGQSNASAAGNIAVVTGIGYGAILIGPPMIGTISQFVSFWWGMFAVAGAGPLMALLAMTLPRQKPAPCAAS